MEGSALRRRGIRPRRRRRLRRRRRTAGARQTPRLAHGADHVQFGQLTATFLRARLADRVAVVSQLVSARAFLTAAMASQPCTRPRNAVFDRTVFGCCWLPGHIQVCAMSMVRILWQLRLVDNVLLCPALVRLLLEARADIELVKDCGSNPLVGAAQSGCLENLRLLLDAGANVNYLLQDKYTALWFAARYRRFYHACLLVFRRCPRARADAGKRRRRPRHHRLRGSDSREAVASRKEMQKG
eukprot:s730_g23.t1